jgi:hypothetical protein
MMSAPAHGVGSSQAYLELVAGLDPAIQEHLMKAFLMLAIIVSLVPTLAFADRGGVDSQASKFTNESYAMRRDGRLGRAMEEQRANKAAFEALKQREMQQPSTGYTRLPRR